MSRRLRAKYRSNSKRGRESGLGTGIAPWCGRSSHSASGGPNTRPQIERRSDLRYRCCWSALVVLLATVAVCPSDAWAQESTAGSRPPGDGLSVTGIGVSGSYFSQSVPKGIETFQDVFRGSGGAISGSSGLRWRRTRRDSYLSLSGSGVYGARISQGNNKNWNEGVDLISQRRIAKSWHMGVGGGHSITNFDEAMFAGTQLAHITETNYTYRQLAPGLLRGASGVPALDTTNAFAPDLSQAQFLFGRRVENEYAEANIGYGRRRILFNVLGAASRIVHRNDGFDLPDDFLPDVRSMNVGADLTYSISRTTQAIFGAQFIRSGSVSGGYYSGGSGYASINHYFRRRWFMEGRIGGGTTTGTASHNNVIYGVGVGFKTSAHSFMASHGRDMTHMYLSALGPASAYFQSSGVSWYFSPPGAKWSTQTSFSHFKDQPPGHIEAPTSWIGTGSFIQQIGREFSLSLLYSTARTGARRYIQDGRHYRLREDGARVSLTWSPRALRRLL
jgi:hypothetical protein